MESRKLLWFDARNLTKEKFNAIIPVVLNNCYDAIMLNLSQEKYIKEISSRVKILFTVSKENSKKVIEILKNYDKNRFIIFSDDLSVLNSQDFAEYEKGFYTIVKDKETMNKSIEVSKSFKNVIIEFESITNIPLELILAFSQKYHSLICKRITTSEDGWIATMTMEMGSHAVLLATDAIDQVIKLKEMINKNELIKTNIEELTIQEIQHIGIGDRVCIDTISELKPDEGMIIGSTSVGGILVSSETHYLPYMDLRPFRVNAGAIHSYIVCPNNTTHYLSELKAGDTVLVIDSKGITRPVSIGRIKIEKRPMLLIKAISKNGINVNTIVQDDWHIRVISKNGEVKNSVLLKNGDIVLGYTMEAGRHLGVAINETIIEK